jgi:hypothetical protein
MFWKMLAIVLLLSLSAYGQSLGDIARENRDKQADDAPSPTKPKVITNKDLPKDPEAGPASTESQPVQNAPAGRQAADRRSTDLRSADPHGTDQSAQQRIGQQRFAEQRLAQQRAAEQWKRQILVQKMRMANLQARIDQVYTSIHVANGGVQAEGPFNRYQARQLQQVAQMRRQLDEQRWKIEQMQDAARHAGMHTAVYDP